MCRVPQQKGDIGNYAGLITAVPFFSHLFHAVDFRPRRSSQWREGRATGLSRIPQETNMPHFLIAGYLPDDFDPSTQDDATVEEIHALNREMIAAGVRRFAGGLGATRTLRAQPDGDVQVTDGPYLETKELVGGITIVETANLDEALAWARKAVKACRMPVEVREIFFVPAPEKV
jgi:hypothetical protein